MKLPALILTITIALSLPVSGPVRAQNPASREPFPYAFLLTRIKQPDSVKQCQALQDSLGRIFEKHRNEELPLSLSDQWTLTHYQNWGWEIIAGSTHPRISTTDWYTGNDPTETYTTADIFNTFGFPDSLISNKERFNPTSFQEGITRFVLNTCFLLCREYLTVIIINSYPDGSQTSFYRRNIYYFKRVEPLQ